MDAYAHLKVLVSLILGLAITRVLSGLSRRLQFPARTEGMFVHIVWSMVLLLSAVHFWWWEFALRDIATWHFGIYVFVLAYASLHFLMATLLYPDAHSEHAESERFFITRRHWFFGIFAVSFLFDLIDTAMKGRAHWQALGSEYPLRLLVGVSIALLAMRTGRPRSLLILGIVWLVYDLSWIIRRYDSLN
ncbi:hypothetical protein [Paracoccus sp. J56]|uniref:hypothetical protein n=1 Tax=Paracoccus sp. J56 TaxID=935850 RepID=UPI000A0CD81D|nr:hypothetical protein [Paracoccus sp. J56]SMG06263.1 hypothetical protein SAMN02746000_00153 [Paracoccus sp. J56]